MILEIGVEIGLEKVTALHRLGHPAGRFPLSDETEEEFSAILGLVDMMNKTVLNSKMEQDIQCSLT